MSILTVRDIQGLSAYGNQVRIPTGHSLDMNSAVAAELDVTGNLKVPVWTTGTRPSSPSVGTFGFNNSEDVKALEIYNGEDWVGASESGTASLPVSSGLVIWYEADSWTSNRWEDKSGNLNHTTNTVGTVSVATHSGGAGATKTFQYITGNTAAGVRISTGWPSGDYTMIHVTRYTGGTRGRIWQGTGGNWLSGHWSNGSGRFYHEGWMSSSSTNYFGDNWFITTDQNNYVRTDRGAHTFTSGGNYNPGGVAINSAGSGGCCNSSEPSDWACAFVAVYNRKLSQGEFAQVEDYCYNKFF